MGNIIEIESFNEYKSNYNYDILISVSLARKVKRISLDQTIINKAVKLESSILNTERGIAAIDETYFSYVFMLMNYISFNGLYEERKIFDHLYNAITEIKDFQKRMDSQLLKNIVDEVR